MSVRRTARAARAPSRSSGHRRVWLFDLDNTLHDANAYVFGELHRAMTSFVARELSLSDEQADALRRQYWLRYGATLIGLVRHHGVSAQHFLRDTHRLPSLHERLLCSTHDVAALRHLRGRIVVLTNAPAHYANRVLQGVGLAGRFHDVVAIERMRMFGEHRPKPDRRMFRHLLARLKARAHECVLVDDTLVHLKAARALGMKTAWAQRYARPKSQIGEVSVYQPAKPPYVCARIRSLQSLRRLQ